MFVLSPISCSFKSRVIRGHPRLPLWVVGGLSDLLLRSIEVNGALASLLRLESGSLSSTARYEVECSIVDEVFELSVGSVDDVDFLDIVGSERLQRLGTLAIECDTEGTETFELNLVAVQELLTEAAGDVCQNALDGAL